jgi:Tol biopolymer transport system component
MRRRGCLVVAMAFLSSIIVCAVLLNLRDGTTRERRFLDRFRSPEAQTLFINAPGERDVEGRRAPRITLVSERGGRVNWSPDGASFAFDRRGDDGFFDIWIMNTDGTGERCLTCDNPDLAGHNGTPAWHPSGDFIVFQAHNTELQILPLRRRLVGHLVTSPGGGTNNNIWIMDRQGENFWQITDVADGLGVLHPAFSHGGTRLAWAEKVTLQTRGEAHGTVDGEWEIKLADVDVANRVPAVSNTRGVKPGDYQLYETHGFTPDDNRIIVSVIERGNPLSALDIAVYDIAADTITNLTNDPSEWDEHAQLSPDGSRLIWASSRGIEQPRMEGGFIQLTGFRLDLWMMNLDGSDKQRLTYFNDPDAPEYMGELVTADSTISPDGTQLVVKVRPAGRDPIADERILQIALPEEQ